MRFGDTDKAAAAPMPRDLKGWVVNLLRTHRAQLESLTQALLVAETLDAPAPYAAAGVPTRAPAAEVPMRGSGSEQATPAALQPSGSVA